VPVVGPWALGFLLLTLLVGGVLSIGMASQRALGSG